MDTGSMSKPEEKEGEVAVRVEGKGDAEELREVLKAVGDFLRELTPTIKELLDTVLNALRGDALGKEVGMFYRSLLEAGVKEETAAKLTEEFIRRKMELANIASLLSQLSKVGPKKEEVEIVKRGPEEESG